MMTFTPGISTLVVVGIVGGIAASIFMDWFVMPSKGEHHVTNDEARDEIRAALNECLEDGASPESAAEQVIIGTSVDVLGAYARPLLVGEARGLARELEHEAIAREADPPEGWWRAT